MNKTYSNINKTKVITITGEIICKIEDCLIIIPSPNNIEAINKTGYRMRSYEIPSPDITQSQKNYTKHAIKAKMSKLIESQFNADPKEFTSSPKRITLNYRRYNFTPVGETEKREGTSMSFVDMSSLN